VYLESLAGVLAQCTALTHLNLGTKQLIEAGCDDDMQTNDGDVEQKCNLLTLMSRIEARSEAIQKQMQCRSVIQGTFLSRYVSLLWEHMTITSVSIR
jgi:hypothetical protein